MKFFDFFEGLNQCLKLTDCRDEGKDMQGISIGNLFFNRELFYLT